MARVGSTNFKTTKMAGYAKEIDVVDESDEEIQRVLQEKDAPEHKEVNKRGIRRNISFSDDISLGLKPSENIITSGNISPNPPRSGSINDKNYTEDVST